MSGAGQDHEARAITTVLEALKPLQSDARHRVLAYAGRRYNMNIDFPPISTEETTTTLTSGAAG